MATVWMRSLLTVAIFASLLPGCSTGGGNSTGVAATNASSVPLRGIAYGPFRSNQMPGGGPQPTTSQVTADLPRLALLSRRIRTYTVAGVHAQIPTIAAGAGIKTWMGGWIDTDDAQNQVEMQNLIQAANQPGVEAVIVGNEVLLRNDQSPAALIAYIRQVKHSVSVPIAYSDNATSLEQHPEVVAEVDIILPNIHPYWDKIAAQDGPAYVLKRYRDLQKKYPDKRVVIGETGWPSEGIAMGPAVPGAPQQQQFMTKFLELAKQNQDMEYFFFEAFDETYKSEANVGPHWGIYNRDGSIKLVLSSLFSNVPIDPDRAATAGDILNNGGLSPGCDIEVDTSEKQRAWLQNKGTYLEMAYPSAQKWGVVAIVMGKPMSDTKARETLDFSTFNALLVDLKGAAGGESLAVGVKTAEDPDNGLEPKVTVSNISNQWSTYAIPFSQLQASGYPFNRFQSLYVLAEFVFSGGQAQNVSVRNVRFAKLPGIAANAGPPPGAIYVGSTLTPGYGEGVNTSEGLTNWLINQQGYMECRYPPGQDWGAVFITVGDPAPTSLRKTQDISKYRYLVLELKGAKGGEQVDVGVKTAADLDDGLEPVYHVKGLSTDWLTVRVPLAQLVNPPAYPLSRLKQIYIVCELVFGKGTPSETVFYRNVRLEP